MNLSTRINPENLFNSYYALRHGLSLGNERGIIVSFPENGIEGYGLSQSGVLDTMSKLNPEALHKRFKKASTLCVTSDFRRARQTAEIFCELHGLDSAQADARLRERNFGILEMTQVGNYQKVWDGDRTNNVPIEFNCESVNSVLRRLLELIQAIEKIHHAKSVILISHGDPLQILHAWFLRKKPNSHRELPQLENAELRLLSGPAL